MSPKEDGVPRRKAILTAAGIGASVIGVSGPTSATRQEKQEKENTTSTKSKKTIDAPEKWLNEKGELTVPESDFDQFGVKVFDKETGKELDSVETRLVDVSTEGTLIERYERQPTNQGIPTLYGTIFEASAGGVTMRIRGGFKLNVSALRGSVELAFEFDNYSFVLIETGITPGENGGLCYTPQIPPQLPLEINGCVDVEWPFGTKEWRIGGSGEACVGYDCPWGTCGVCRGLGLHATVDFDEGEIIS